MMPHDIRDEEEEEEDDDITKYESEIPPTPAHLLAEIPQPGTWETWRDPAWKKYALKLDGQFDEILSYHYKLVEAIPTNDELLREVEDIVKKAWSLRLEYTLKYSEFMEDPKLSREHCRKFAKQLHELQQFHLMTAFDVRLKTINRNQEKSRTKFDLQKQWIHGQDMGPRIDVTLVTDDQVEPAPSQQQRYPRPVPHRQPHPAHAAQQPHHDHHPRHTQPQLHVQRQHTPPRQTQPHQMQPRHTAGSSSSGNTQPQQTVQRQHTQSQVPQTRYQPRAPSPLGQTLNAVAASTSTQASTSPPTTTTTSGAETRFPGTPTSVASTSTSTSQAS